MASSSARVRTAPSSRGRIPSASSSSRPTSSKNPLNLLDREEEYKRMNADIEAKTANIVAEAERLMRGVDLDAMEREEDEAEEYSTSGRARSRGNLDASMETTSGYGGIDLGGGNDEYGALVSQDPEEEESDGLEARVGGRGAFRPSSGSARGPTRTTLASPASGSRRPTSTVAAAAATSTAARPSSAPRRPSTREGEGKLITDGDPMLQALEAGHLPDDAAIRFLKAKLRVAQEENSALQSELLGKNDLIASMKRDLQTAVQEKDKGDKASSAAVKDLEKLKKTISELESKLEVERSSNASLGAELEQLKRATKQDAATHKASDLRLNRALEENDKLKRQLQKAQGEAKETDSSLRSKSERLEQENKKLVKQKAELIAAFKKQMKLIDILKRQKMHIEAAKMLGFSEEEFVKALDWGM